MQVQIASPKMSREDIIKHCVKVLESRGLKPIPKVPCGIEGHLLADIVCGGTVYEIRENLDEPSLYQGTGQGLVYLRSLRLRRLIIVGYVPAIDKQGKAFYVAANIEKYQLAKVSFLDLDPFWEIVQPSSRWLKWSIAAVAIIAIAVFSVPLLRDEVGCRIRPYADRCINRVDRW